MAILGATVTDYAISRRQLLGAGAAAGAGALLSRVPEVTAASRRRARRVDVAIVGAGFAGLTAARELVRRDKSVVVLEARNRVGGRVLNHHLDGGDVSEAGGTFVGPTQNRILHLAEELGVGTFPTYNEGNNVYVADGDRIEWSDTGPTASAPPDPLILADLAVAVERGNMLSEQVPVDAPWEAAKAREWDAKTFEEWIHEVSVTKNQRWYDVVPIWTRPAFGAEMRELSFLFAAFYVASSGNERNPGTFERNFNTRDGAQERRIEGGSQILCLKMARQLGDRVVLGTPVRRIEQHSGGARVHSRERDVDARRVIVAVPPELSGLIAYDPTLPRRRRRLNRRLKQAELIKVAAVYPRPFWREAGYNGTAATTGGPVSYTVDDSPPDGKPGVVFGFVGGDLARAFKRQPRAERRAAVLRQFVDFWGPRAAHPRDYFETHWPQQRWSRGGPVGIAGPGDLTACGPALRRPVGRIHWAGTETSNYWNGYMDGAVRSGERAAREVLDEL
jgi:monoamine oxidase